MITPYRPEDIKPYYPSVLDIETASNGSVIAIGHSYEDEYGKRIYNKFDNWSDFVSFLCSLISNMRGNRVQTNKVTRIYAHNGANFDFLSLVEYLRDTNIAKDVKYIINGSTGIGVTIMLRSKIQIKLYDSYRMLPAALDKLCVEFATNTQKEDVPEQYKSKMELFLEKYCDKFYSYLRNDVNALQEVLFKFWSMIYDLDGSVGYLPMTLPALAMRLFRKLMGDDEVITIPWNEKVKAFTRRGYTGGRVEAYKPGKHENVNIYDVNSMYPYVMASNSFPASHRAAWVYEYDERYLGFYEVEYTQAKTNVPPVLRDEQSNDFTYNGSGVYTADEINLLREVDTDATITIKKGVVFQKSAPIFRNFVEKYYSLRRKAQQEGNTALAFVCKILLNSLYGKFGQRGVKQQIESVSKERISEVIENGGKVHVISEEYMVTLEADVCEHEFVAIAAYVTSYARIVLYRHILEAGDAYLYCDTDSVHMQDKTIETGDNLGQMKLEYSGEIIILGKKLYYPKDGKPKAKGIGRALRKGKLTYDVFNELLDKDKSLEVEFDTFPTVKEVLGNERKACLMLSRKRTIRRLK